MILALLLTLAQATGTPGTLAGHVLVYSARARGLLLVGGDAGGEAAGPRPLYRLSGSTWVPVPGSELPARSLPAAAAVDEGNVLMHGGALGLLQPDGALAFQVTADTWRWDGSSWQRLATSGPAARDHHGMVFDSHCKVFVLFGGSDADPSGRTILYGDTWEWRNDQWELVAESGPAARVHHAMAFDPVRDRTLLLGGSNDGCTWAWDGTRWEIAARGPPADRSSPRLAWDPEAARILLFGGTSGSSNPRDTWAWDGTGWSVIASGGPPGRSVHAMAFDEIRGRTLLFGGADRATVLGDLWQFSGDEWTRLDP